jgi:hypothetical protein
MSITRKTTSAALSLVVALPALALVAPVGANAQGVTRVPTQIGATQVETVPPAPLPPLGAEPLRPFDGAPVATSPLPSQPTFTEERVIGPDGVETIIRTRRIYRTTPYPTGVQPHSGALSYPVGPSPVVFEREQWLAECNRRVSGRSEKEKGGIIGGLLGAIGGGVAGNLIAATGDKLAGTLIGGGVGALGGLIIGSLIGGGKKGDKYDCDAALDGYLTQYGQPGSARTIPYPYPPSGYQYAYNGEYAYSQGCGCQQPQVVLVPIRTEVRQRVVVTERVTEQLVPGDPVRYPLPPRPPVSPSPKLIKQ